MINSSYIYWMIGSALICSGVHLLISRGMRRRGVLSSLTLALGFVLGAVCARGAYMVIQLDYALGYGLRDTLISDDMAMMSFLGGAAGALLGAVIAAKCTGNPVLPALNAFAPAGALMVALARFGEYFLGMICAGNYVEDERWCFFPLSVGNEWGEWYIAVFMIAGIIDLVIFLFSLLKFKRHRFLRTVFYLCLMQVFCESLRNQSLIWSEFVRAEQLLSMIIAEAILILWGVMAKGEKKRFLPAVAGILCAGLFVAVEFAVGGKLLNGVSPLIFYAAMLLGLAWLGYLECRIQRRIPE